MFAVQEISADICIYGGTAGGVVAAVQAARMGKTVALVGLNKHLGGMTTSGLGWTDIGHVDGDSGDYIQGVAREFYNRIGVIYGSFPAQPKFEPHVAETVFNQMVQEQSRITLYTNLLLVSVVKQGSQIIAATMNDGTIFRAKMFIDASFTGDLMAKAGVSYTYGRESTNTYGESLNGIRSPNSDFTTLSLDPYVVAGNPASGLLPLIQTNAPGTPGTADQRVQAYNFRLCLTTVASNKLAITAPPGYNTNQYELLARYVQAMVAAGTTPSAGTFFTTGTPLPNNKLDANNSGALSTDFVGESAAYVEADDATRAQIWQAHKNYQQGFLYFLGTDLRLPTSLRNSVLNYGLCKDEFTDNGGWPYEIYVREGRRMISDYVMTQSNVFNQLVVPDSIGMAGYFTDSHYLQRVVISGGVRNEGNARGDISVPYPISYRAIVPKAAECSNLFVPWCLSASHTAYSSLRMEPVFMILGQACGTAACFAIDDGVAVQNVSVPKLQAQLVDDDQYLGIATTSSNATVVDDADAAGVTIVGSSWTSSTGSSGYYGSGYLHDGNTNKGLASVTFTPTLSQSGSYQVYVRWTSNANRATNVPIDVIYPGGTNTFFVNQTQQGGQWVLLMTTNFNAGTAGSVRIRNAGTTGYVIADAIEFVAAVTTVSLWATDAQASRYGPQSGSFTVSRTGVTNTALTVNLNIGGTAVNGVDYQPIASSVNIPAGVVSTNISVTPYTNSLPVGNKTVAFSLASSAAYATGALAAAAIAISDTPINSWRWQYFGSNATNSSIAGDSANPAGDHVLNLMKYALGLNPTQAVTSPIFGFGTDTNGYFALSYTRPDPPPLDVTYQVDASNDLATWCTNNMCVLSGSIILNSNGTATVTSEADIPVRFADKKFLRLRVSRQ